MNAAARASRCRALAVALVALGAFATFAAGAASPALRWPSRLALLFALPFLASVVATLLVRPEPGVLGKSARIAGTARFHLRIAAVVAIDMAAVGVGYAAGWITFTFGERLLEAHKLLAVPLALPFTIAAATLGTEWALHARLFDPLSRAGRGGEGALLAIAAGVALALPAIVPGFVVTDGAFVVGALALAALREATALLLFRAGGLFVAGAYRGTLMAIEAFGLGDWSSYWFPMANYVTSEPRFYLLRVGCGALALLLLIAFEQRAARRPA